MGCKFDQELDDLEKVKKVLLISLVWKNKEE